MGGGGRATPRLIVRSVGRRVGAIELSEDVDCVLERWRRAAAHAAPAVGFGQEENILEVVVGFQALAGAVAEGGFGIGASNRQVLDEPCRSWRDKAVEGFETGGYCIAAVDREADIMREGGRQQFFVARPLVVDERKNLQRMFECISLGMTPWILADGFENRHERGELIKTVADCRGQ